MTLRAARWSRVSSRQQNAPEREGLPAQRDEQTLAIEEHGWTDSGLEWIVTHSGGSVHETPEYAQMLAAAGKTFDVLVVSYVSRLGRVGEESLATVRKLTEAKASVLFVQEDIHTANEQQWSAFAHEAVNADSYRRQLKLTMQKTYASRWRRRGLPGGRAPTGYTADWQIDPVAAELVRTLYTEYALGNVSQEELATRHGLRTEAVKETLRSRVYMGLALRHGEERPGAFPAIIEPALFERVASMRADRQRAGGPPARQPSMLQGKLFCACGTSVRLDGRDGVGQPRVRHPEPCTAWGPQERRQARYYTEPLIQALSQIRLTDEAIERAVAGRSNRVAPPPRNINWAQLRKRLRDDFDAGRIDASTFIASEHSLLEQQAENDHLDADDAQRGSTQLSDERYRACLQDFVGMLGSARGKPYESEVWANVVRTYFERIEHLGPRPHPASTQ